MTSSAQSKTALISGLKVTADTLSVDFDDGRSLNLPLGWYPRLKHGTARERAIFELIGDGHGVHWPLLDEDLSAEGLLAGRPSGESLTSFQRWLSARKQKRRG